MAKKQTSAEAENPMGTMETETMGIMETLETAGTEADSGFERRDEEPGAEIIGQGAEYEALPTDQNGMNNDGSGFPPDVFPGENGLSPGSNGPPSGGIPPEWEDDSSGYTGHLDGIPNSPGSVSPDALTAVLDGVEVLASGDEQAGDDVVIPYGEDAPEDSQPPDDTRSGGPPPDMEENPEISTGQIGGSETAPPVAAGAVRRRMTQTRARTAGDSASGASVGAADVSASRNSSRTDTGRADSAAFIFRTPTPAPVILSPAPASAVPARRRGNRPPAGDAADRAAFFGLQFNRLDRNLTPEQRQEWNSIYASYRGRSVMSGTIVGVDRARVMAKNPESGAMEPKQLYFAVVIPYRVRIVIPQTEMWFPGEERPDFVLRNMDGAKIDFIIFKVDRENGLAVGSRKMTLPTRRYYFSTQPQMHTPGSRVQCSVMAVGPRRCFVNCHGYDLDMTQREMSWKSIPDLRDVYHNGDTLDCIVKEYYSRENRLVVSVKETEPNPFDGAEFRHPVGCSRTAFITGKYGGGVFCTLLDDVTVMCNYAFQYDDSTFSIGDRVVLMVERYEYEKKQVYGKIVAKR